MEVEQAFEQREGALGRLKEKWTVFKKKIWSGHDKEGFAKLQQQVDFDDDEERQNSAQCRPSGRIFLRSPIMFVLGSLNDKHL